jgi:PAS domain S-box-containing protein
VKTPLRVLCIEDSENDAALVRRMLERAGSRVESVRVESAAELRAALPSAEWDLLICDYNLPGFSAPAALAILQESGRDIPFIVVSGNLGEELAVEMMRSGAHDYVMKDNLARFIPAVERELREAGLRAERRSAAAALREADERWQFALEGLEEGVWDWNVESGECFFSRQWCALVGRPDGPLVGTPAEWETRLHADDVERSTRALREHLAGRSAAYSDEVRLRNADDTYRWYLVRGKLMKRTAAGAPARLIGTLADITERVEAEAERERLRAHSIEAQKMESIGRLASRVAHDFNKLLTVINGYSQLALLRLGPADPLRSSIEAIQRAGNRASALVRQLLAFGRRHVHKPEIVDLNALIGEMLRMLAPLMDDAIEVVTELDGDLPRVLVDRHHVEHVLLNLVVNARDAMPAGGRLTVETSADGGLERPVRMSVRDTGVGMCKTVQEHLFQPFFTTKEEGKGTGLGLATARTLVEESRGLIQVESAPGQGSVFHVLFPAAGPEPEALAPDHPAAPGGSETILLVEDQPDVLRFISTVLKSLGYQVIESADPDRALELVRDSAATLLLTDLVMPKLDGRELATRAVALRPALKVLYMSGYGAEALPVAVRRAGAFLRKPFTPVELALKVREHLDRVEAA